MTTPKPLTDEELREIEGFNYEGLPVRLINLWATAVYELRRLRTPSEARAMTAPKLTDEEEEKMLRRDYYVDFSAPGTKELARDLYNAEAELRALRKPSEGQDKAPARSESLHDRMRYWEEQTAYYMPKLSDEESDGISCALADAGRRLAEVEKERDGLKEALKKIWSMRGDSAFATSRTMCDIAGAALIPSPSAPSSTQDKIIAMQVEKLEKLKMEIPGPDNVVPEYRRAHNVAIDACISALKGESWIP